MRYALIALLMLGGCAESSPPPSENTVAATEPMVEEMRAATPAPVDPAALSPAAAQPQVVGAKPMRPPSDNSHPGDTRVEATLVTGEQWDRAVGGEIRLELVNRSEQGVRYTIASGMLADFALSQGSKVVWRFSQEMMFTQALTQFELEPGQSRVVRARVSPQSLAKLSPGRYTVTAELNTHPRGAGPRVMPVTVELR
ncbi:BsuPI-related putative proteinase inhibitor [Ferrimonas balearica]|uniref:BsuPI-related putative proteinase inhibitor n=1 Tax=Ferrimonas balearica TaxID=44012 RepID=UPI001C99F6BD|nr:BsuPI-related putative proteinase inhibitor [Ferrimonas balearica]MBY5992016.1 hypothetical protein [Ferrimonas balearica]